MEFVPSYCIVNDDAQQSADHQGSDYRSRNIYSWIIEEADSECEKHSIGTDQGDCEKIVSQQFLAK